MAWPVWLLVVPSAPRNPEVLVSMSMSTSHHHDSHSVSAILRHCASPAWLATVEGLDEQVNLMIRMVLSLYRIIFHSSPYRWSLVLLLTSASRFLSFICWLWLSVILRYQGLSIQTTGTQLIITGTAGLRPWL